MKTLIGCFLIALIAVAPATFAAATDTEPATLATFEGRTIRIDDGWGPARACHVADHGVRCYRSESEMDRTEGLTFTTSIDIGDAATTACTPSVRLYEHTSYSGAVLHVTSQHAHLNLATYSFNNRTSSYRIGGCAALFRENTNGTGATYPGNTNAWANATAMVSGWNNRIGSVYIYG